MECRTLSHVSASCSGLLRPVRVSQRLVARVTAPRRPQRLHASAPKAVASFAAPNSNAGSTTYQEAAPITDIPSPEALDAVFKANPDKLVILMCKAQGCRPCKAFRPKYGKLAVHYADAIFCEILGDRSEGTRGLMRNLKVRATPTFIFFRGGQQVHMHSGINAQKMVDAMKEAVLEGEAGFCAEGAYAAEVLSSDEASH